MMTRVLVFGMRSGVNELDHCISGAAWAAAGGA